MPIPPNGILYIPVFLLFLKLYAGSSLFPFSAYKGYSVFVKSFSLSCVTQYNPLSFCFLNI